MDTKLEPEIKPANLNKRRPTIVEEAEEGLIETKKEIETKKKSPKKSIKETLGELYNSEYREFLERDSKGWFKLSIFYFIFYVCLSGFFVGLLYVFYLTIDVKTPTYFNKESVMNHNGICPGLGFRPQYDVESELIEVNEKTSKNNYESLDLFLEKYRKNKNNAFTGAHGRKNTFDYEEFTKDTPCSREKQYGYNSKSPCVVVKLNRIYGWLPIHSSKNLPVSLNKTDSTDSFVYIHCGGEYGADRDNIFEVEYFSKLQNHEIGGVPFKYFPFRNQPGYLSPLVFVHFKNVSTNTLINVECRAYAKNIEREKLSGKGVTKFQLFVS